MTAFGATVYRPGKSLWVWAQIWACADNTTWPLEPTKRFLSRRKANRWCVSRIVELEHQEARAEWDRWKQSVSNGGVAA